MSDARTILKHLIYTEEFGRKSIPFLKTEYFQDRADQALFSVINDYVKKYNRFPSREAVAIDLTNRDDVDDETFEEAKTFLVEMEKDPKVDVEWLLDIAEDFCRDRALYNALATSVSILNDKTGTLSKGVIPKMLTDALGVNFNTPIGHDFLEDYESRFEMYHEHLNRLPWHLNYFNKITRGGMPGGTLTVALAGTGVGKSMFMCDCAANNLMEGKNVLYITPELSEKMVGERIDANLMDVELDLLEKIPKDIYVKKINKIKEKTVGKLIVKEYPTSGGNSANFRHLLNELRLKKGFIPHVIYIDYINICGSARLKNGAGNNSYERIKMIAEELRGLAMEFDVPVITATQTNRGGFGSTDVNLEDTAESFGLPATADFMFALMTSEELESMNQVLIKQLKNRFTDVSRNKKFVIGVDKAKMKFYDVEQSAQRSLNESGQTDDDNKKSVKDKFKRFNK